MKITAIKSQQKIRNRYSIYCNNRYAFSVSETMLLEQKLAPGQILSSDDLKHYKQLSEDDKALNNALRYAAIRNHSRWEMEKYLKRKDVGENQAAKILTKLESLGFVDDQKFASSWVENRRLLKSVSKVRLRQELRAKHLDRAIIDLALENDQENELTVLKKLISKKRSQSNYKDDNRLIGYLSRQGFSYSDIKQAITES